jgi:FkbM family methyltransferase
MKANSGLIGRLSAMPNHNPVKRLLRAPLHFIPPGLTVPVLGGPLRGKRWIAGSSINRCWLGTYDRPESDLMRAYVPSGGICFDIGAQAGYHTLYASTLVGETGRVYAFEPAPANVVSIMENMALNRVKNVTIFQVAVSDFDGTSHFDCSNSPVSGRLTESGTLSVHTISLDHEVESGALPEPDYIKIDAEGSELKVLRGAYRLLTRRHPTLSVETHQWLPEFSSVREDCIQFLHRLGYKLRAPDPSDTDGGNHLCAPSWPRSASN